MKGWLRLGTLSLAFLWASSASAQMSPHDHAAHHPGRKPDAPGTEPSASPAPVGADGTTRGGEDGEGGMDGMMGHAGAPPPEELDPPLMDLPDLPPGRREEIERRARERMTAGGAMITAAADRLSDAASRDDYAAMREAAAQVREALAQFESGLAARRVLAEGKAPRSVALLWFKRDMNHLPADDESTQGILGMTWFHYFVIFILTVFAALMVWMHFHRMRRAQALLARLTAGPAGVGATSDPGAGGAAATPAARPGRRSKKAAGPAAVIEPYAAAPPE